MPDARIPTVVTANSLIGTWRLKSYVVTTAAGERTTPYGPKPRGLLSYSADGHMQVIGVADERVIPVGSTATTSERAALYDTLFAYAGTYSVEGNTVTHHVEISWNGSWTNTDQLRIFERNGNTLTLGTRMIDATSGAEVNYTLEWEKTPPPN